MPLRSTNPAGEHPGSYIHVPGSTYPCTSRVMMYARGPEKHSAHCRHVSCCVSVPAQERDALAALFVPPTRPPSSIFSLLPCPSSEACLCPIPCPVCSTHDPNTDGLRCRRTLQLKELRDRTLRRLERARPL